VAGQRQASTALPPGKRLPNRLVQVVWVDPRAVLEGCGKFCPNRDSIPGPFSP